VYRAGDVEIRRLFAPLNLGENAIVEIDLPKDKVRSTMEHLLFFRDILLNSFLTSLQPQDTGKFYGVAFVQFDTPENAQKACMRNSFRLLGRPVTVQLKGESNKKKKVSDASSASPPSSTSPDSAIPQASSSNGVFTSSSSTLVDAATKAAEERAINDGTAVFVAALADSATDEEIMTHFSKSGRVLSLRRIYDKVTKDFTGAAFVQYADVTAAKRSLGFNRTIFHNRPLRVEMAKQKTMK